MTGADTVVYLIATKPIPENPAWWDMEFVRVNDRPTPFASEDEARKYMDAWGFSEPKYTIWKLERVG